MTLRVVMVLILMTFVEIQAAEDWKCDFEGGADLQNTCGLQQELDDVFDWRRLRGRTGSSQTGPYYDHTTGNGHYIYIETTSRNDGDVARISLPERQIGQECSLQFWYHMFGTHIKELRVVEYGNHANVIWSKSGNQGNNWNPTTIQIPPNVARVSFEGERGTSFRGDIALDDLSMTCKSARCDYNVLPATCEWQYRTLNLTCEAGKKARVHAFWGRVDSTTCVDQVDSLWLQTTDCPGNDDHASQAVQAWCDQKAVGGLCRIRAAVRKLRANGQRLDPCVGTFKYLKTCVDCVDDVAQSND